MPRLLGHLKGIDDGLGALLQLFSDTHKRAQVWDMVVDSIKLTQSNLDKTRLYKTGLDRVLRNTRFYSLGEGSRMRNIFLRIMDRP